MNFTRINLRSDVFGFARLMYYINSSWTRKLRRILMILMPVSLLTPVDVICDALFYEISVKKNYVTRQSPIFLVLWCHNTEKKYLTSVCLRRSSFQIQILSSEDTLIDALEFIQLDIVLLEIKFMSWLVFFWFNRVLIEFNKTLNHHNGRNIWSWWSN